MKTSSFSLRVMRRVSSLAVGCPCHVVLDLWHWEFIRKCPSAKWQAFDVHMLDSFEKLNYISIKFFKINFACLNVSFIFKKLFYCTENKWFQVFRTRVLLWCKKKFIKHLFVLKIYYYIYGLLYTWCWWGTLCTCK